MVWVPRDRQMRVFEFAEHAMNHGWVWLGPILWTSHPWNEHNKTGANPLCKKAASFGGSFFWFSPVFVLKKNSAKLWTDHKGDKMWIDQLTYYQYYQLPSPCLLINILRPKKPMAIIVPNLPPMLPQATRPPWQAGQPTPPSGEI